jgi:hypothetical protein
MAKVLLAKHNDMVKAIPPDRSDKPLRTSVLPKQIRLYERAFMAARSTSALTAFSIAALM